jgi:glycosyltransferase involved in cell wall biosynthesis
MVQRDTRRKAHEILLMTNCKTIVHIANFQPRANRSMDTFLLKIAEEMRIQQWRTVFVFCKAPMPAFAAQLRAKGIPFLVAQFPLTTPGALELIHQLRPYRPQVMHTFYMSPFDVRLWAVKLGCGIGNWVVSDRTSGLPSPKRGALRQLASWRGALTGAIVQRIIAVSHFVATRDIESCYLPAHKIAVIHNGVDINRFVPAIDFPRQGESLRIVYVGQLIPQKGVMLLLQAMRTIMKNYDCEMLIAGEGRQAPELQEFCHNHGLARVQFLGQVEQTTQLYASADVVVVPSVWEEAFGFVVAEAMACGACVLAADGGGIPEVIGADCGAGMTFRRGDVDHLCTTLCHLLESPDLRKQMGIKARQRIVQQFSDATMVARYADFLDETFGNEAWEEDKALEVDQEAFASNAG